MVYTTWSFYGKPRILWFLLGIIQRLVIGDKFTNRDYSEVKNMGIYYTHLRSEVGRSV